MSIDVYIKSKLKDKAVYWGAPTPQADGTNMFAAPIEINCFWEGEFFLTHQNEGKAIEEGFLRGTVHVGQDLDEQGMLYHGRLTDLTTDQKNDPHKVSRAYIIKRFIKTPSMVVKGAFIRVAMTWYGQ